MRQFLHIVLAVLLATLPMGSTAQNTNKSKKMEEITATALYGSYKANGGAADKKYGMKTMLISGVAVKVGPDVYGLPSVEVAGKFGESCKALCVLPFMDYLKLRKVSKRDRVVVQGEVRGYAAEFDLVVVKQCKIVSVNGKKP